MAHRGPSAVRSRASGPQAARRRRRRARRRA
ncbi:hypothetical protein, partial [Sphaerisporangium rubeum]